MSEYHFKYAIGENPFKEIADGETKYLSSEVAGGFIGVYLGLYATGNGIKIVLLQILNILTTK